MRADRIKVGMLVDISLDSIMDPVEAAKVVDTEHNQEAVAGLMGWQQWIGMPDHVALRLRQEGKNRGCWVAIPATNPVRTLRR